MSSLNKNENHDSLIVERYISKKPGTMLLDYYEKTIGTPTEQGYFEMVYYTCSDTHARLEVYTDGGLESEQMVAYLVPYSGVQQAFDTICHSGMTSWRDRTDLCGITGKLFVCKYPAGDDQYIRLSSESMPENGQEAFYAVRDTISGYADKAYLIR